MSPMNNLINNNINSSFNNYFQSLSGQNGYKNYMMSAPSQTASSFINNDNLKSNKVSNLNNILMSIMTFRSV